jgi:two-component system, LytTR family, sensor kinase
MKKRIIMVVVHVIAWILFCSLPYIFRPKDIPEMINMRIDSTQIMIIHSIVFNIYFIFLFYLHGFWMVPKLLMKKRILPYSTLFLILFFLFMFLRNLVFPIHGPKAFERHGIEFFSPDKLNALFLFLLIMAFSFGIWMVGEWIRTENKAKNIEAERVSMELSFLRSQLNPHFLFNTLNSIYSLALAKSNLAADAVMKLSDIMRYITDDAKSEMVPLIREVAYMKQYVELQKIRLNDNINIDLQITGDIHSYKIPPLILMPFVENAFKYGVSAHEPSCIRMKLNAQTGNLKFKVSNIIIKKVSHSSTALGISNTRKRLEQMYPKKYRLEILEQQNMFIVNLDIQLT